MPISRSTTSRPMRRRRSSAKRSAMRCFSRPTCYGFSSTRCIMPMSMATCRRARLCPRIDRGEPMAGLRSRNISVSEASRPLLPRHAKLKFDETRQRWVILAPERVLAPDDIAVEILQLCDGVRSVAEMIDQLAEKYAADRGAIGADVIAMLQDLADKGFLTEAGEKIVREQTPRE